MTEREELSIPVAHVSREDLIFVLPQLVGHIQLLDEVAIHEIASQVSDALQETHHLTMRLIAEAYLGIDTEE